MTYTKQYQQNSTSKSFTNILMVKLYPTMLVVNLDKK